MVAEMQDPHDLVPPAHGDQRHRFEPFPAGPVAGHGAACPAAPVRQGGNLVRPERLLPQEHREGRVERPRHDRAADAVRGGRHPAAARRVSLLVGAQGDLGTDVPLVVFEAPQGRVLPPDPVQDPEAFAVRPFAEVAEDSRNQLLEGPRAVDHPQELDRPLALLLPRPSLGELPLETLVDAPQLRGPFEHLGVQVAEKKLVGPRQPLLDQHLVEHVERQGQEQIPDRGHALDPPIPSPSETTDTIASRIDRTIRR